MSRRSLCLAGLIAGLGLVVACGEDPSSTSDRTRAGKADTSCYCDSYCQEMDDCCAAEQCGQHCPLLELLELPEPACPDGSLHAVTNAVGGCVRGFTCVATDKQSYERGQPIVVTLTNLSPYTLHVPGCAPYAWGSPDGVPGTPDRNCVVIIWDGASTPVATGESHTYTTGLVPDGGEYQLAGTFGVDCGAGRPQSCERHLTQGSNVFQVSGHATPEERCLDLETQYLAALRQARRCTEYDYYFDTSLQCTKRVWSGLRCTRCETFVNVSAANAAALAKMATLQADFDAAQCGDIPWSCMTMTCRDITWAGGWGYCDQDGSADLSSGRCSP